jgi:hypothetical protein
VDGFPEKAPPAGDRSYYQYQARGGLSWTGFKGSAMPPPEAVKSGKVAPLSDEERRTIFRWIDLGCPLDLDFQPSSRGNGWMLDDQRPTLTLAYPQPGANKELTMILIGMHDYDTGLDMTTFQVTASVALDGIAAGENLAPRFRPKSDGIWELALATPLSRLAKGGLTASVRDRQGNTSRIVRSFSVEK